MTLGKSSVRVLWNEIAAIEVDEERAAVRLDRLEAAPALIPPTFGGHGAYGLADLLRERWKAACPDADAMDDSEH